MDKLEVDRIMGAVIEASDNTERCQIELQWTDQSEGWHSLILRVSDCVHLLSVLSNIVKSDRLKEIAHQAAVSQRLHKVYGDEYENWT